MTDADNSTTVALIKSIVQNMSGVQEYFKPEDTYPIKLLVQFDRVSGKYRVTFEDTDETRWKVTPRNLNEMREALRPNLDTELKV